jgi:hypothetical protein
MATAAADAMTRLTRLLSTANIVLQPSADGNKLLKNPVGVEKVTAI